MPVGASPTRRNGTAIELEDFGCKKFYLFLYRRPFKIVIDHKPLESVFSKPGPPLQSSIRIQTIANRMMDYDFRSREKGKRTGISDYTSRYPMPLRVIQVRIENDWGSKRDQIV